MLTEEVRKSIDDCVLCWLATADVNGQPNVSPKEVFTYFSDDRFLIANIASPQSAKNVLRNEKVCVSFVNVLLEKGFQIHGNCELVKSEHPDYTELELPLLNITQGKYPFQSIFCITVSRIKPILAPSYFLYPEKTLSERIQAAKENYGL